MDTARLTLDVVMDHIVLPSGRRCFVVVEDDRARGLLTLHRIRRVPRDRWLTTRIEEVMVPRSELKTVSPDDDLNLVFERMAAEDINQFPVLDREENLLGIVARHNVLAFLRTQARLGV